MKDYGHYSDVEMASWRWRYFRPFELRQRENGRVAIDMEFIDKISKLRVIVSFGLEVTSYYRSEEYNELVSDTGLKGPHTSGRAIDFLVYGGKARILVGEAINMGFTGIGINQRGPYNKRFIHLDDLSHQPGGTRPWIWTY